MESRELSLSKELRRLILLALALGLVYGFVEAAEVVALSLIPGALSWRNGNSSYILWVSPIFYGALFTVIGIIAALFAAVLRRVPWELVLVFCLLLLGAFLAASLQGQIVSTTASLILALGIAVEGARQYRQRREQLSRILIRGIPFLVGALVLAAIATVGGAKAREAVLLRRLPQVKRTWPNVLLLVMDTQRADHLSLYGYRRLTSPRLDGMGGEATVFNNASANSSWTLPSHATMFTGRLPFEHRAGLLRRPYLGGKFPTIAEVLEQRGYATGGFVANTFWAGRQTGLDRGFIHYEDFYGSTGDAIARTTLGRRLAYDVLPRFGFVDIPGRKRAGHLNRDFLSWLDDIGNHPFFAFVNYLDVHGPLLPPAPFAGSYSGRLPSARRARTVDIGALGAAMRVPPPDSLRLMVDLYDESIRYLDHHIGALLDSLDRRGLLDNTLVIVTADHGESFGDHALMFHGHSLYRDQTHVPLIVRMPSRAAPSRIPRSVGLNQIPATIAEVTGLPGGIFPGVSLLHAATGARAPESAVVTQVGRRSLVPGSWPTSRTSLSALVTERWHYIQPDSGRVELYDIAADPREEHDLSGAPDQRETMSRLRAELRQRENGQAVRAEKGMRIR